MVDFERIKVNTESFSKLASRLKYNSVIADYYRDLSDEICAEGDVSLYRKADRLESCSDTWEILWHRLQGYKGILNAGLCRDKFCVNCQSALAKAREAKFFPMLTELSFKNSIYHVVFTIPNCVGIELKDTVHRLFKSLSYFVKYLNGRKKLRGFDFEYLGYEGCIRSLEVSFNKSNNTYHPHLHCLFCFDKNLELDSRKYIKNTFSYSREHADVKYFSDEESLFQKIWFLLCTGKKVSKETVAAVNVGYSVSMNRARESDYKEVFKYAFKGDLTSGEEGERARCLGYEQFKTYYTQLKSCRFIQGYGSFLDHEYENVDLTDDVLDMEFYEFVATLDDVEVPVNVHEEKDVMISNMEKGLYKYYSKSSIKQNILEEKIKLLIEGSDAENN